MALAIFENMSMYKKVTRGWSSIIRTDVFGAGVYIFAERAS